MIGRILMHCLLSDTAALGDRGTSVLQRSCSASDEGRWRVREGGGAKARVWRYLAGFESARK